MTCFVLTNFIQERKFLDCILPNCIFFNDASQLTRCMKKHGYEHTVILDVEFKGNLDFGFNFSKEIRKISPLTQIILLSFDVKKRNLCFDYKIAVLDFIDKTSFNQSFTERIKASVKIAERNLQGFALTAPIPVYLPHNSRSRYFDLQNILYIESDLGSHYSLIHEKHGITKIRASLSAIEKIHSNFCRTHGSYCINIQYLDEYQSKNQLVTLINQDKTVPVSKRFICNLNKAIKQQRMPGIQ